VGVLVVGDAVIVLPLLVEVGVAVDDADDDWLPSNCVEFPDPLIRMLLGQILDPDEKEPSWKYSHSRADWYVHVTKLPSEPEDIRGELELSDEGQLELVLELV